jgi:hypothetical protein
MRALQLVPFAEFPVAERDALLALVFRLGIAPHRVCVSRLESLDEALPSVALVSVPGWTCSYQGLDWIARLERDLGSLGGR